MVEFAAENSVLNDSLFLGMGHARNAIAAWVADYNTARQHSSVSYQTPAAFAAHIAATGSGPARVNDSVPELAAQPATQGMKMNETLIAAGCKFSDRSWTSHDDEPLAG